MQKEAQMFATLFKGLERAYTVVNLTDEYETKKDGSKKRVAKVFWRHEKVDVALYEQHLLGKQGIGIGALNDAGTCYFGVIDIDEYNWSEGRLKNLCNRIEQSNMHLVPARSKSGGVRLYVFCEETPAKTVILYLKTCAVTLGFPKAEIFPSSFNLVTEKNDVGVGIALPYFNGDNTECPGFWKEKRLTLSEFIKTALSKFCKGAQLKSVPGVALENTTEFADGAPCLQAMAVNGFPEGTRDTGLFNIGVYLRLKHGDDGADRFLEEYNDKLLTPPLDEKSLVRILKSVKKKTYFYTCKKEPLVSVCNRDLCLTRKYGVGSGGGEANIKIGAITKLDSEPPLWLVEINNHRIQMETEDFIDMRRFTVLCIDRLHIIPNLTINNLKLLLQKSLETAVTIEAPDDASLSGQCIALFEQYLHSKPPAATKDHALHGAPWYENGKVFFRGKDFMDYLDMEKFRKLDSRQVWAVLREYNLSKGCDVDQTTFRVGDRVIKLRVVAFDKPDFKVESNEEDF